MTQIVNQVRIRLILQLLKDFLRDSQKLLRYFNGTTIPAFIVNLYLKLSDLELTILSSDLSL